MGEGEARRVIIIGAAGRDFHDFNVCFRQDPGSRVVAFTAAQIPDIDGRVYPPELAGPLYPGGVPIHSEDELTRLIREHDVHECLLSYSDLSYADVMHKAGYSLVSSDNLQAAVQALTSSGEVHLPVINNREERRFIGMVHEHEVMAAYHKTLVQARK